MIISAASAVPLSSRTDELPEIQPAIFAYLAMAPESFQLKEEIYSAHQQLGGVNDSQNENTILADIIGSLNY